MVESVKSLKGSGRGRCSFLVLWGCLKKTNPKETFWEKGEGLSFWWKWETSCQVSRPEFSNLKCLISLIIPLLGLLSNNLVLRAVQFSGVDTDGLWQLILFLFKQDQDLTTCQLILEDGKYLQLDESGLPIFHVNYIIESSCWRYKLPHDF